MMRIDNLPPSKQALLERIVARLSGVPGIAALALGGSYARGTQRPDSDLDVGLYYHDAAPFDLDDIRAAAAELAPENPPAVTDFYGWGAWVNGGAWIHTLQGKVDFLYRSIQHVQRTIDEARAGITHHDYDQQPPYGFYSVIYLGETQIARPLYDPGGALGQLKAQVAEYPPRLKEKISASALWLAEFSLVHAEGFAAAGDVYTTAGALTRAASFMTQALFALNETYFITDKTALREIAGFAQTPARYGERLSQALGHMGTAPEELRESAAALRRLWKEVAALGEGYESAFKL